MAKTLKGILESFEFNRAALAKQKLANLRRSGRKVRGARIANLMRMAGLREEEIDDEDVDQLDEVLAADATASDWIHDFVHSSNPKFAGKSKKERIKMALGAYYDTKNQKDGVGVVEEAELNESAGLPHALAQVGKDKWHIYDTKTQKVHSTYNNKNVAMKKYGELNDKHAGYDSPGGIVKGKYGVRKEEVEQIDELSKKTLGSYVKKASHDARMMGQIATDFENRADRVRKQSSKDSNERLNRKYLEKAWKRDTGIGKAVDKLTKEEVELNEGRMKDLDYDLKNMGHDEFHKQYGKPKSHFDPTIFKKPVQKGHEMERAKELAHRGMRSVLSKEEVERIEEKNAQIDEGTYKPEVEKSFPASGVKTGASAPKGKANTMPKDKEKAKGQPAGCMEETEMYEQLVHVSDGSKYDETPHPKDIEHIKTGAMHTGGQWHSHTDKGALFKFKTKEDAENFKRHVDKCPHKTCYADLTEETIDEGKVYDPITKKMVANKPIKVQAGGGATKNGVPVETGPSKYKSKLPMSKAAGVLAAEEREVDNNEEVCVYCQEPRDDKHSCCQENHFVQKKELTKEAVNPGLMAILKARQSAEKTKTLTNNQKKLDKNKNGKLDADDFKKLRKEAVENKDDREYGYEGDMVITQLKTLCRHADHLMNMLKPETDLPEWVQSKITLATDYIQTSHDYLMSEMNEETLDERNKANATMRKNMDASRGSKYKLNNPVPDASPEHKNARDHNKAIGRALRNEDKYAGLEKEDKPGKFTAGAKSNHTKGINLDTVEGWKDAKKPVKEEIEMEEKQISFTEFLQLNEMEFVNGRYVHKGTYGTAKGAKYGNTDYERDTLDSKEDESGSEPKRGRGRPKGAGSGARENLGKSKLHQGK